ncbi:MAG TPA: lysylphosphatidylglycerol synthase transmembrane domain-containing protein [Anaerolineales bacterium]|nr:lysylphosphatidylglycerol synthase transmembrane domain-containing protein [Anaerolineales bacterium]HRQ93243.1 lysylphosphatidylglycerol synthase transmembrane domain-containing protein [Anaerolineales bacterium]
MRKLFIGLILLLGVLFLLNHFTQFDDVVAVLQQSDWRFVGLALLCVAGWLLCTAATYQAVFAALGIERPLGPLVPLAAAANFVNVVAPSMGMSGMAVLISDARKRKLAPAHATVVGALFILFEYAGFALYLVLGLIVLFRRDDITGPELAASGVLLAMTAVLLVILYLGMRAPVALGRFLRWIAHTTNKLSRPITKRDAVSEERAEKFAHDIAEGLRSARQPRKLLKPLFFALLGKGMLLCVLTAVFMAFQTPLSVGTLIAGFAIAYLFLIVSPTPAGVGVVEGVLTLSLSSMFVPLGEATVITLSYRVLTFWLPLLFGFLSFQLLQIRKPFPASS